MQTHSEREETLATLAVISLFRVGFESTAARHAKTVFAERPRQEWVDAVAELVWADEQERQRNVNLALARVDSMLRLARESGHQPLTVLDPDYPELLKTIADPPLILWTQGDKTLLSQHAVAVVGSRSALPSSITFARMLVRDLSDAGLIVISGLARGVDSVAHQAALDAGGRTVAVIGCGLTRVYPARNDRLAAAIRATGTIVSELPPDAPPAKTHFPLRNRIISGLCCATVVIEAGEKSGSLITAKQANEQGRSVLVMPGSPLSGKHIGSHRLIKDGARLVDNVEDVLEEIRWPLRPILESTTRNHLQLSDLESNMARGESYSVDNLASKTRRSTSDLLAELSILELSGRVVRTAAGEFVRR